MAKTKVADIRNIAFCGHGSAGKTTLLDKILIKTGAANGHPSVDEGTSICDFDPEEKEHKYTIEASLGSVARSQVTVDPGPMYSQPVTPLSKSS